LHIVNLRVAFVFLHVLLKGSYEDVAVACFVECAVAPANHICI